MRAVAMLMMAMTVAAGTPAQATMFSCQFSAGGSVPTKTCSIDTTQFNPCSQVYSSTLTATCQGATGANELACYFVAPSTAPLTLGALGNDPAAAAKMASELPGFRAVAIQFTASSVAPMSLSYTEQHGATSLYVVCIPIH